MCRTKDKNITKPANSENASTGGRKKKPRTRFSLPPPLPVQEIPPGDHPPRPDEARERLYAERERAVEALFTLNDLQDIVSEVGAPPLPDNPKTRMILIAVCWKISSIEIAKQNEKANKISQQRGKTRRKEWQSIRKHLIALADGQRKQITWFNDRPWYGREAIIAREQFLEKIIVAVRAMDDLEPWIFLISQKRGQHGGSAIKDTAIVVDIFVNLTWAWEDAGCKPASAEKRYRIIQKCLEEMGIFATIDAIRKAITEHLRKYPFHAQRPESETPKHGRK